MASNLLPFKRKLDTKKGFVDPLERDRVDEDFIVPVKDSKGHSVRVGFRMQQSYEESIGHILGTKVFPYQTESDFIRHAIARHLLWTESLVVALEHKPLPSAFKQLDLMRETLVKNQLKHDFIEIFNTNAQLIRDHQREGYLEEALRVLAELQTHIAQFHKQSWKGEFELLLNTEFAALLALLPVDPKAPVTSTAANASPSSTPSANVVSLTTFAEEDEEDESAKAGGSWDCPPWSTED